MFTKPKQLQLLNQLDNTINNTPNELIKKISDYLTYSEAYNFAMGSRKFFSVLDPKIAFKKRPDYITFLHNKENKLEKAIENAVVSIDKYLTSDAVKPDVKPLGWNPGSVVYDNEYRQAICFKDILKDKSNDILTRSFALYVLLCKDCGKKLKLKVQDELGHNVLKFLEWYIHQQFSSDKIKRMAKTLLNSINDAIEGPLPDRNEDYIKENVEKGFTKNYVDRAMTASVEKRSSCVVS